MNLETLNIHVGNRLRTRRKELRISQRKLAEQAGIVLRQLQKYESGQNKIGADRLYLFSKILEVDISYFFYGYNDNLQIKTPSESDNSVRDFISAVENLPPKMRKNLLTLIKDLKQN